MFIQLDIDVLKQAVAEAEDALHAHMQQGDDEGAVARARQRLEQAQDDLIRAYRLADAPRFLEEATQALRELEQERRGTDELLADHQADMERLNVRLAEIHGALSEASNQAAESLLDNKPLKLPPELAALTFERDAIQTALGKLNHSVSELQATQAAYPEKYTAARRSFVIARREVYRAEALAALTPLLPLLAKASCTEAQVRGVHDPATYHVEFPADLLAETQQALRLEIPA